MPNIKRFSPNWSDPDDLEAITVAREDLISGAVDAVRESALTKNKHHLLFIGPRGCGKTHLITLVHHRISQMDDVMKKLRIAWLNEDETSDTLLSLLLRVHRALSKRYPSQFPAESTEPVYDLTNRNEAAELLQSLLLEQLGEQNLLIMVENLDALFGEFAVGEEKRWRALIQNHPQFSTLATAQRLFPSVSDRDEPFFGFFNIQHLKFFTASEATEFLEKIAREKNDAELAKFISSHGGKARIRALHHLTGGNQRLFIILSEFINRESLDSLVDPFEELVDEQLTPYYQERLRWLPTLQRRIVEFLCVTSKPQPVKTIARHLFSTSQTISSQLMELRKSGYLISKKRGRESLYELAEPLMRLSYQVKEAQGRSPLRLLVDFLRVWYDRKELESRLRNVPADAAVTRMYYGEAYKLAETEGNLRLQYFLEDADGVDPTKCSEDDLALLRDLKNESGNLEHALQYGIALGVCGHLNQSTKILSSIIETKNVPTEIIANALLCRGFNWRQINRIPSAIKDYSMLIETENAPTDFVAKALINRGIAHGTIGDYESEISDYTLVTEMENLPAELWASALHNRGVANHFSGSTEKAIEDYSTIISSNGVPIRNIAEALVNRGIDLAHRGDFDAAIADFNTVVEMDAACLEHVAAALYSRGGIFEELGETDRALESFFAAVDTPNTPCDVAAPAHFSIAGISMEAGDWETAKSHLQRGLSCNETSEQYNLFYAPHFLACILQSGQSRETWESRVDTLISSYNAYHQVTKLGSALVVSIRDLRNSELSGEGLSAWNSLWSNQADIYPELELPARLLGTAVEYFQADEDESILFNLPSDERLLLAQALGLESGDTTKS